MNEYKPDETISVRPIKTFPLVKDLVADVSWNYKQNKKITPFTPDHNKKDSDDEGEGAEEGTEGGKKTRGEKKIKKAMTKLGMKPFEGITRVTIKKGK